MLKKVFPKENEKKKCVCRSLPQIHLRSEISGSKLYCVLQTGKSGALVCKACRVCPSPSSAVFFVTNCGVDAETYSLLGD